MLMGRYAGLLGKSDDAAAFSAQAAAMKAAFIGQYFNEASNDFSNGSQTSSILPLAFGMVPEDRQEAVFEALVKKIVEGTDGHVGTGLVGGQWLMRTLADGGRSDLGYTLASHTTYPSWGFMVEHGATTVWELWNGNTADPAMNSHNHVMLVGDLVLWLYERLGGIRPEADQPGFKAIVLKPEVVGDLEFVRARHESPFGPIVSEWSRKDGVFAWDVEIPANTKAMVHVPTSDAASVREGGKALDTNSVVEGGYAVLELGSGRYRFESQL
jgi:alpha-L-rhamnosidase